MRGGVTIWGSIWLASATTHSGQHSFQPAIRTACVNRRDALDALLWERLEEKRGVLVVVGGRGLKSKLCTEESSDKSREWKRVSAAFPVSKRARSRQNCFWSKI